MEDTIIKALLLGYAHIECNGTPIRICLKKAQGLLFYLLVHKKATRDELTGLLWGGEDNELARRHLRDNLYHLKKVVPIELVVPAGRSAIQLNPELGFYIDVDEFLKAVDVEAYQGEFLKGFSVEGRYDKNTLSQVVDAVIVELGGFAVFNDKEKQAFLRKLAKERGIILFTDPDGAGFVIRNRVKGNIPEGRVLQAYVPDIYGKEKRKRKGGKEGKLGVEGMKPEILLDALRRAGATIDEESTVKGKSITKADLYDLGLIGPDSVEKRKALCKRLELPEHLSANALVEVLNLLMSREELQGLFQ